MSTKAQRERVSCICCEYTTTSRGLMICCDRCDTWMHNRCMGLSKEEAESLDGWICPRCEKTKLIIAKKFHMSQVQVPKDNIDEMLTYLAVDEFEDLISNSRYTEDYKEQDSLTRHPEIVAREILRQHVSGLSERERRKVEARRKQGIELPEGKYDDWCEHLGIVLDPNKMNVAPEFQEKYLRESLEKRKYDSKMKLLRIELEQRHFSWINTISSLVVMGEKLEQQTYPKEIVTKKEIISLTKQSINHGSTDVNFLSWAKTIVCSICSGQIPAQDYALHSVECAQNGSLTIDRDTSDVKVVFKTEKKKYENVMCGFCTGHKFQNVSNKHNLLLLPKTCLRRQGKGRKRYCSEHHDWRSIKRRKLELETTIQHRLLTQIEEHLISIDERNNVPEVELPAKPEDEESCLSGKYVTNIPSFLEINPEQIPDDLDTILQRQEENLLQPMVMKTKQ